MAKAHPPAPQPQLASGSTGTNPGLTSAEALRTKLIAESNSMLATVCAHGLGEVERATSNYNKTLELVQSLRGSLGLAPLDLPFATPDDPSPLRKAMGIMAGDTAGAPPAPKVEPAPVSRDGESSIPAASISSTKPAKKAAAKGRQSAVVAKGKKPSRSAKNAEAAAPEVSGKLGKGKRFEKPTSDAPPNAKPKATGGAGMLHLNTDPVLENEPISPSDFLFPFKLADLTRPQAEAVAKSVRSGWKKFPGWFHCPRILELALYAYNRSKDYSAKQICDELGFPSKSIEKMIRRWEPELKKVIKDQNIYPSTSQAIAPVRIRKIDDETAKRLAAWDKDPVTGNIQMAPGMRFLQLGLYFYEANEKGETHEQIASRLGCSTEKVRATVEIYLAAWKGIIKHKRIFPNKSVPVTYLTGDHPREGIDDADPEEPAAPPETGSSEPVFP